MPIYTAKQAKQYVDEYERSRTISDDEEFGTIYASVFERIQTLAQQGRPGLTILIEESKMASAIPLFKKFGYIIEKGILDSNNGIFLDLAFDNLGLIYSIWWGTGTRTFINTSVIDQLIQVQNNTVQAVNWVRVEPSRAGKFVNSVRLTKPLL